MVGVIRDGRSDQRPSVDDQERGTPNSAFKTSSAPAARKQLAPLRFPMHRNSGRACHPWAQATYADAEHVFPRKRGGSSRHEGNLVAACERCNRHVKGARTPCEIGWTLLGVADDGWDGLVWAHEPLIALLGSRGGRPLEGEPVLPYRDGAAWRQVLMAPAVPLAPARQDGVTQQEEQREGYRPRW